MIGPTVAPDYFHQFERILNLSLAELCSMAEHPNGLYFCFDPYNQLQYIGKASSRSFIERIPSHFDQRHAGWFNTLPKKILGSADVAHYPAALAQALAMRLVLRGIRDRATTSRLEGILRSYLQPNLNPGKATIPATQLLREFVP